MQLMELFSIELLNSYVHYTLIVSDSLNDYIHTPELKGTVHWYELVKCNCEQYIMMFCVHSNSASQR